MSVICCQRSLQVHVSLMVLMIIAGLTKADADNMRPLFLEGGSW